MATRYKRSAAFALALQLASSVAVPLAEPMHDHRGAPEAQWHAANDACERAASIEECALLGQALTKAVTGSTDGLHPVPSAHVADASVTAARHSSRGVAPVYPRGPPAA